jgi:hypothetical protein
MIRRTLLSLGAVSLLALAGCDQPGPLAEKKAAEAPAGPPAPPPLPPRPAPPTWAVPIMSQPLAEVFPKTARCTGAIDGVRERYVGARAIAGWGWNEAAQKPVAWVVAVNRKGLMVGFGEGGQARPDLAGKEQAGWTLVTIAPAKNGVSVYGVDPATKAACLLGEVTPVPAE